MFKEKGTSGILIQKESEQGLSSFEKEETLNLLKKTGYILFRGFDSNLDDFSRIVQSFSSKVALDPARKFGGTSNVAQKVDAGTDAVGLHCENGNSPFLPDLCWFYCEKAPKLGSQTTVCDGIKVWEKLSTSTRKLFEEKHITYSRRVEEDKWKKFAFHMLEGTKQLDDLTLDDLLKFISNPDSTEIILNKDNSINYSFSTSAIKFIPSLGVYSFANSILGPSYNYEKPKITFEDGKEISQEVIEEIECVTENETVNIDWQDNDIIIIDNIRVMHGRRKILDTERTIYNALSFI